MSLVHFRCRRFLHEIEVLTPLCHFLILVNHCGSNYPVVGKNQTISSLAPKAHPVRSKSGLAGWVHRKHISKRPIFKYKPSFILCESIAAVAVKDNSVRNKLPAGKVCLKMHHRNMQTAQSYEEPWRNVRDTKPLNWRENLNRSAC